MNQKSTKTVGAKGHLATFLALILGVLAGPVIVVPTRAQTPAIKVGDTAPEIKLEKLLQAPPGTDTAGTSLKGKVVVLEFWATWRLPCVPAFIHLNKLAENFKDKPVQFIAITDEEDESAVARFLKERPMRGWIGLDTDSSVFTAYKAGGRPHTVLLDRDGKIAAITYPENVTAKALNDLLAGKRVALPLKPPAGSDGVNEAVAGGEDKPLFQVTIEPSPGSGTLYGALLHVPGRIESDGIMLSPIIQTVYRTPSHRIVESVPLPKDFYKFKALAPKGREELLYPIFQQALEVTFGLKVRREMRDVDVWVLTPADGKASSLRPSQASEDGEIMQKGFYRAKRQPIKKLADTLESFFLREPVVDETGLKAEYDWDLPYNRASNNVLLEAIRAQLGLELVKGKRKIEYLVIERVDPAARSTDGANIKP